MLENLSLVALSYKDPSWEQSLPISSTLQPTLMQPPQSSARFTQGTCVNPTRGPSGAPGNGRSLSLPQIVWPYTSLRWPEEKRPSNPSSSCTPPLFSHYCRGGKWGSKFGISACRQARDAKCNSQAPHPGSWRPEARLVPVLAGSPLLCCTTATARRWRSGNPS